MIKTANTEMTILLTALNKMSQAEHWMEDKSSVCSFRLKLATEGDKITLSGREFQAFTTRL